MTIDWVPKFGVEKLTLTRSLFFLFIIVHAVRLRQTWTFMFNKNNGQNFVHTNRKGGVRFGQPPYNKLEKRLVAGSSSWSVSLHSSVLLATW